MVIFEVIFIFIIAHLIGDYVLQTRFIAESKGDIIYHLFVHCALYTFAFYLGMLVLGHIDWLLLAFIFSTHIFVDNWKSNKIKKDKEKIMKYYLIDQIVHYLFLIAHIVMYYYLIII